jgi:hypothetical protein
MMIYQRKAHSFWREHDRSAAKLLKAQHFSGKATLRGEKGTENLQD